jgi:hypothetical protein
MPIRLAIDKRDCDGALQICIERTQTGTGLRLLGPKYDGKGKRLASSVLTKADADQIRSYLDEYELDA